MSVEPNVLSTILQWLIDALNSPTGWLLILFVVRQAVDDRLAK